MLKAAGRVIVVADSSKFGRKSLTLVSDLDAIDAVVSDDALPARWREFVAGGHGCDLVIAEVPNEDSPSVARQPQRSRNEMIATMPAGLDRSERRAHRP
jgi:hypothetical protein